MYIGSLDLRRKMGKIDFVGETLAKLLKKNDIQDFG